MSKNLLKNIGVKTILPLAFAVGLGSCAEKYNLDGRTIKDGSWAFNSIVEYDSSGLKIRYAIPGGVFETTPDINRVIINGKRYTKRDTAVYESYNKRYHYLINKIDSIENAKEKQREQEEIDYALQFLK